MERHYCDICNKLLVSPEKSVNIQIKRNNSPCAHVKHNEICDDCATDLTLAMDIKIAEIRSKGGIVNG